MGVLRFKHHMRNAGVGVLREWDIDSNMRRWISLLDYPTHGFNRLLVVPLRNQRRREMQPETINKYPIHVPQRDSRPDSYLGKEFQMHGRSAIFKPRYVDVPPHALKPGDGRLRVGAIVQVPRYRVAFLDAAHDATAPMGLHDCSALLALSHGSPPPRE